MDRHTNGIKYPLQLFIYQPGNRDKSIVFHRSSIFVGRDAQNDLQLQEDYISEQHGRIDYDGTTVHYTDLDSLNGSYSGSGVRLPPGIAIPLRASDEIVVGRTRIRVGTGIVPTSDECTTVGLGRTEP